MDKWSHYYQIEGPWKMFVYEFHSHLGFHNHTPSLSRLASKFWDLIHKGFAALQCTTYGYIHRNCVHTKNEAYFQILTSINHPFLQFLDHILSMDRRPRHQDQNFLLHDDFIGLRLDTLRVTGVRLSGHMLS